jgi:MerR family transcriptional regulator/heat shock protein HspR
VLPFDDENLPVFTVGQVAQMLEVQQAFLRRLDEFGVVCPSRSAGGQRRYSRTEVTAVRYVAQLVEEGMTLAAIRRVLELEAQVSQLVAERDALLDALAERDRMLIALTRLQAPGTTSRPGAPDRPGAPGGAGPVGRGPVDHGPVGRGPVDHGPVGRG